MNPKQLVRLSNIIGIIAIVLLIYWVFTFITIEVFGLKVFRENLTETFYMSVLGILALMAGALIINIMFNLTRIAQKHNQDDLTTKTGKKVGWILLASFPILLIILFGGDYLTSKKKERLLVESAKSIIEVNTKKSDHLVKYEFDEEWIIETEEILEILSKTDDNFPHISILVKDSIDGEPVFLGFRAYYSGNLTDTIPPVKKTFITKTTQPERDYLNNVFENGNEDYRYSSHDGRYELFYPFFKGQKRIVIYFSEYQRYGKIGS
ncbi:MAG: peptidase [Flavobacteriales bacterium]|nr:peptidase [Flavobacteriales bacterium]|tara:strand:+ start:137 stop:931 length:795 start_codon:yes stop_codon:yes gene_type:complete